HKTDSARIEHNWSLRNWFAAFRKNDESRSVQADWEIIDYEIAADLVDDIGALIAQKTRLQEDKGVISRRIAEAELETSRSSLDQLRSDLAEHQGAIDELKAQDDEWIARASKGAEELTLRIRAQAASSSAMRA